MDTRGSILVVDDEQFNLEILGDHLESAGYEVTTAEDGSDAWTLLEGQIERFDTLLLDRMMPGLNGMELLARLKQSERTSALPVIMQTAMASPQDIVDGLRAGAHYYLTKPFGRDTLLAVVDTAVSDYRRFRDLRQEVNRTVATLALMERGRFTFRTLDEGRKLAVLLSNACADPQRVVTGLAELLVNAVEHGNLGISYQEKSALNEQDQWLVEVERRMALAENRGKWVEVELERDADGVRFTIRDQGGGFDWREYLEFSPERAFDSHGRGIAMANMMSFDRLEYRGAGNEVVATIAAAG